MKRWLLFWALCALPGLADEAPQDPFDVMETAGAISAAQGDDAVYVYLSESLRRARLLGPLPPDWGLILGVQSDMLRNTRQNPAQALLLAEEGLEVAARAAEPDQQLINMLSTTRAFALADLGRFEEAHAVMTMALPMAEEMIGKERTEYLRTSSEAWAAGQMSYMNTSATDLANKVLDRAETAIDRWEYGQAVSLAAQAQMPEGTALPQAQVRSVNARAGQIAGHALNLMGQNDEAVARLLQAAALIVEPGWEAGAAPIWKIEPVIYQSLAYSVFFWLSRAARDQGNLDLGLAALSVAESVTDDPKNRVTLLFSRSGFAWSAGDKAGALAAYQQAEQVATSAGLDGLAALTHFYIARERADQVATWAEVDTAALIAATDHALDVAVSLNVTDAVFLNSEASFYLANTDAPEAALRYARAALQGLNQHMAQTGDTAAGKQSYQRKSRTLIETLLFVAHRIDTTQQGANCPADPDPGRGCAIILENPEN